MITLKTPFYMYSSTIILEYLKKMKVLILASYLIYFHIVQLLAVNIWFDIIIPISKFLFGTPKLIYQINALGVVGGVLGRFSMMKFHHNYADFPAQIVQSK